MADTHDTEGDLNRVLTEKDIGLLGDLDRVFTEKDIGLLQLATVLYYVHEGNPINGLIRDKTDPDGHDSGACGSGSHLPKFCCQIHSAAT
jgi:hypothetical protein